MDKKKNKSAIKDDIVKFYYPNNKPILVDRNWLIKHGKAIVYSNPTDFKNITVIGTLDIFGRHEVYFLEEEGD